jgi:hypothetical protein
MPLRCLTFLDFFAGKSGPFLSAEKAYGKFSQGWEDDGISAA